MTQEPNHQKAAEEALAVGAANCTVADMHKHVRHCHNAIESVTEALAETESATVRRCLRAVEKAYENEDVSHEDDWGVPVIYKDSLIDHLKSEFNLDCPEPKD